MIDKYNELKTLFINNPQIAVNKCQDLIVSYTNFNNYQEFYTYHLKHPHISSCQAEWSEPQMAIHCYDCSLDVQSCVCLDCFLNGNHQDHDYIISGDSTGNCDCGDLTLWKHSGCCHEHQGVNQDDHPENYLDENLRNALTDVIFKSAFASFPRIQNQSESKVSIIFQFLSSFLQFGDGFRRLLSISLTEKIKFDILLRQVFEYKLFFNKFFQQFCGSLLSDQLFKVNFARANFDLMISKTIPIALTNFLTHESGQNYSVWTNFWFHSFQQQPIKSVIEKFNWDWVTFSIKFTSFMKNFSVINVPPNMANDIPTFFTEVTSYMKYASLVQPNEQTQRFFDELFTEVLNCGTEKNKINDCIISASFNEMHDTSYYFSKYFFKVNYYVIFNCFKLKKNLKFDKFVEELERTIDISPIFCIDHNDFGNENDLFVSKYVDIIEDISSIRIDKNSSLKVSIEEHFKSFHNGGAFFYSFPLFDSLLHLFRLDNMSRVKISRLLAEKKFKKLRIQLGIVALKKFVGFLCCHQSLVSKRNFALINLILACTNKPFFAHRGITLIFPLIQLLIGLQSEDDNKLNEFSIKEFFAFEMAREIGIFDDYSGNEYKDENVQEKQEQMLSSFLYVSILLNVERTLFNFNTYYYMEEQIISALKQGISSPAELSKRCVNDVDLHEKCHSYFDTIVSKVARVISNKSSKKVDTDHDISFALKDEIEWKPISIINPFNEQKTIVNKEISKHANTLLKIQDFEDEVDYFFHPSKEVKANVEEENNEDEVDSSGISIKLKEFLSTPTVLAIVYHTLRKSESKIELVDHLAMNILILISKFVEDFESVPFESSISIHYDSTILDLVKQLKKKLFNFKVDEDGNANIINTFNSTNFKIFLNMKIGSKSLEPKSLVDILLNKGEIGKNVLRRLSIDFEIDSNEKDKQSMKEINKQRANKLKQSIINQYKNIISNYYTNDVETPEEASNNEDVCSICASTKKDQILSYPLYIYRTKIPFIVDKPPFVEIEEGSEIPVDENRKEEAYDFMKFMFGHRNKKDETKPKEKERNEERKRVVKRCTEGNNFVIQFSICQHPIHQSCVKSSSFKCPVDRTKKNGFLPCFDGIQPSLICSSEKVDNETIEGPFKESIMSFMKNYESFFDKAKADVFIELAKSISGLITTYEVRLRSLPDCLDSPKNLILARNLFLTTWYSYRFHGKPDVEILSKRMTLFQRFILKLIQCDELEGINASSEKKKEAFQRIFSSFIEQKDDIFVEKDEVRRDKEIFMFMKRVCLTNHFILNNEIFDQNQAKFIDWDDILSVSNLSEKYGIDLPNLSEDFEFKPIVFAKLPKDFLRFGSKPFNFPIKNTRNFTIYNILDYNDLIRNFDDFEEDKIYLKDEDLEKKMETTELLGDNVEIYARFSSINYPSVFLLLGMKSSYVVVVVRNTAIYLKPFYVDRFGCQDVGFRRGQQLHLDEEKYGRIMDLVLSGDFSFYIKSK